MADDGDVRGYVPTWIEGLGAEIASVVDLIGEGVV